LVSWIVDEEVVEQIGNNHAGKEPHGIIANNHKMTYIGFCAEGIETVTRIDDTGNGTQREVMEAKE
jgi:hypothetical protein